MTNSPGSGSDKMDSLPPETDMLINAHSSLPGREGVGRFGDRGIMIEYYTTSYFNIYLQLISFFMDCITGHIVGYCFYITVLKCSNDNIINNKNDNNFVTKTRVLNSPSAAPVHTSWKFLATSLQTSMRI